MVEYMFTKKRGKKGGQSDHNSQNPVKNELVINKKTLSGIRNKG
jgi:hypothetical protein